MQQQTSQSVYDGFLQPPSDVYNLIQRPQADEKLETKVLAEICVVANRFNTPINIQIVQGDIVQEETDAIVNPTDQFLEMTKGVGA